MHDVPLTRLAFAVQGLQRRLAMDIVQTAIHDASHKAFKGMDLRCAAPDTGSVMALSFMVVTHFRNIFTSDNTLFY